MCVCVCVCVCLESRFLVYFIKHYSEGFGVEFFFFIINLLFKREMLQMRMKAAFWLSEISNVAAPVHILLTFIDHRQGCASNHALDFVFCQQ